VVSQRAEVQPVNPDMAGFIDTSGAYDVVDFPMKSEDLDEELTDVPPSSE